MTFIVSGLDRWARTSLPDEVENSEIKQQETGGSGGLNREECLTNAGKVTTMTYRVSGLPLETASSLIGLDDDELSRRGAKRYIADSASGFPCRVTLQDAPVGEQVLLFNYEHQPADTPFRSRHAIFVRENALSTYDQVGPLPEQLSTRLLSIRAFDAAGMMLDADIVEGAHAGPLIERLLADVDVAYLHAHYARRGCYAARIERA